MSTGAAAGIREDRLTAAEWEERARKGHTDAGDWTRAYFMVLERAEALQAELDTAKEALADLHAEVEMCESVGICLLDRLPSLRAGEVLARLSAADDTEAG